DRRDLLDRQTAANDTLDRQRRLRPIWTEITHGGLKTDAAEADSQARHAVLEWMQSAGVNLKAVNPERTTNVNQFQVISFHVTGNAHMYSLARLLWSLETATIPVRVNDVQIKPQKEGTDDLTVDLSISTLCLPAATTPAGKTPATPPTPPAPTSESSASISWERS
ncbi:MAG TPA: GspMb/PilO family protein, partial [Tepidisphaeraceae bacterium]|nr:GspMb/PilO family protein [Tepidisphaeraceae bacterium]